MNLTDLLNDRKIRTHGSSEEEIDGLREVVNWDITDASIEALSDDRRFATAYNAVLQLSTMAISCAGYRASSVAGHHLRTFEAAKLALGSAEAENLADYFDLCRRKRNNIDYDSAEVVSKTEADELLEKAREFQILVEEWIENNFPAYKLNKK